MLDAGLLTDLRAALGESGLITGEQVRERAVDINGVRPRATAMARPRSTEQVAADVAAARSGAISRPTREACASCATA